MTEIWHNPRCSKSRQTLALLQDRGVAATIRLYLQDAPSKDEIRRALRAIGLPAAALIRSGDPLFAKLDLTRDAGEEQLISAMNQHPVLIERPLVLHDGKAALGRPPEAVLKLF